MYIYICVYFSILWLQIKKNRDVFTATRGCYVTTKHLCVVTSGYKLPKKIATTLLYQYLWSFFKKVVCGYRFGNKVVTNYFKSSYVLFPYVQQKLANKIYTYFYGKIFQKKRKKIKKCTCSVFFKKKKRKKWLKKTSILTHF